jgi:CDP-diacylglycerol--glycerol-3-phosphate 3-phosphatidyltransferase
LISAKIGHALDPLILKTYHLFFGNRVVNPNLVTVLGAATAAASSAVIAFDFLILGGIILLVSGFFDLSDGAIARSAGKVSPFGGFLDSVLDRYSDLLIMLGVAIHLVRHGDILYSLIAFVAAMGTAIIPYAKARAEGAALSCKTGLLERPERMLIVLIGLFFNLLPYAVILLAVFTHVTVIQRILYVRRQAKQ